MEGGGRNIGEEKKKKVMVAIDENECSFYALKWALENLYESLQNSEVVLFTAQPISVYGYIYASSFGVACKFIINNLLLLCPRLEFLFVVFWWCVI